MTIGLLEELEALRASGGLSQDKVSFDDWPLTHDTKTFVNAIENNAEC